MINPKSATAQFHQPAQNPNPYHEVFSPISFGTPSMVIAQINGAFACGIAPRLFEVEKQTNSLHDQTQLLR
jgi:hypothetical protein